MFVACLFVCLFGWMSCDTLPPEDARFRGNPSAQLATLAKIPKLETQANTCHPSPLPLPRIPIFPLKRGFSHHILGANLKCVSLAFRLDIGLLKWQGLIFAFPLTANHKQSTISRNPPDRGSLFRPVGRFWGETKEGKAVVCLFFGV